MAEEGTGKSTIARLEKGNTERTARHAQVMNELIDGINSLRNATVRIQEAVTGETPNGKWITSDANTVLDLHLATGASFPDPDDTTKVYVWGAEFIDDAWVFAWRETVECVCTGDDVIDGGGA
jgi:hypothetical protein